MWTLCAPPGEGLLARRAAKMQREGHSLEETAAWLEENRLHVCHWFTVDDLQHLRRGGRISAATAIVGTALQVKPILRVDETGHLENVDKVRGRRRALSALVERFDETGVVMSTAAGMLVVTGEDLHIGKLSLEGGELFVDGRIDSIAYEDAPNRQGGFFSRLFG